MKILKISLDCPQIKIIEPVLDALAKGEVIMHPTETCYGLAVDIFNQQALERLYVLKKMNLFKPTSFMVRNQTEAEYYAEFPQIALDLVKHFWPGPLTLVLKRRQTLPSFFNSRSLTVGIRCPDSAITQLLLQTYKKPLATTSANVSGLPETYQPEVFLQQIRQFKIQPAFILDAGAIPQNPPSTLVGFQNGNIQILRNGSLAQDIKQFFFSQSVKI